MRERGTHTSNDERRPYAVRDCLMNWTVLLHQCFRWKHHCCNKGIATIVISAKTFRVEANEHRHAVQYKYERDNWLGDMTKFVQHDTKVAQKSLRSNCSKNKFL